MISFQQLIADLNKCGSLAFANLQAIVTSDAPEQQKCLSDLACPSLQFLNISDIGLTVTPDLSKLDQLSEVVAHSNKFEVAEPFLSIKSLRLLDLENNQIKRALSLEDKRVEVINLKGNPCEQFASRSLTSQQVMELSKYKNFKELAFGEPCKPKPAKRVIKVCPNPDNSSSSIVNDSFESPHSEIVQEMMAEQVFNENYRPSRPPKVPKMMIDTNVKSSPNRLVFEDLH